MSKYRTKPDVIEAFQMTKERRWDNFEWPSWLNQAWNTEGPGSVLINPDDPDGEQLIVNTDGIIYFIAWGDWIVKDVDDTIYTLDTTTFESKYEPY